MMHRLLPALLILLAVGIFFGYTNPVYTGPVAEAQTQIKGYDAALEAASKFEKREEELELEYLAIPPADLERLETFLPDNVNNIQLILDLDALAARSGVRLSNFSIGEQGADGSAASPDGGLPLESTEALDSLDITVTATGTYAAFQSFLDATEKSLRPLDIVGLVITTGVTGVYTYDITFRIYWLQ